ncbi:hypothetical protein C8Q70DRAFT_99352 [Cubamyces menziesii]|nr:hypothetical protein C8Q70DRAFT_99352 [Cubamyces menziesii]
MLTKSHTKPSGHLFVCFARLAATLALFMYAQARRRATDSMMCPWMHTSCVALYTVSERRMRKSEYLPPTATRSLFLRQVEKMSSYSVHCRRLRDRNLDQGPMRTPLKPGRVVY